MKPHAFLLVILVLLISDSFASSTSFDCKEGEAMADNRLGQCHKGEGNNVLNGNDIVEISSDELAHAQTLFDGLIACGKNVDVKIQNDIVINCLEKVTHKTLQVRLLRKIASWANGVKSYQPLNSCDEATLEYYPKASSENIEIVLCFQFESHKTQTGLVFYSQENEQLKINGIQF